MFIFGIKNKIYIWNRKGIFYLLFSFLSFLRARAEYVSDILCLE